MRTTNLAGPGFVAVVGGEGQEARVVHRRVIFPARDDDPHVIVETHRGDTAEMIERFDVLANRGFKVHRFGEVNVLTPRVAQNVAEQVDAAFAFDGEVHLIGGPVHLSLRPWGGFEPHGQLLGGRFAKLPEQSLKTQRSQWAVDGRESVSGRGDEAISVTRKASFEAVQKGPSRARSMPRPSLWRQRLSRSTTARKAR